MENAVRNSVHEIPSAPEALPSGWTTLRRRLLLIVTIALIPIIVVSIFQGVERVQRDVDDVRAQLTQSAKSTAENFQNVFGSGEQIMRAMGSIADVRAMTGNCDSILADTMVASAISPTCRASIHTARWFAPPCRWRKVSTSGRNPSSARRAKATDCWSARCW